MGATTTGSSTTTTTDSTCTTVEYSACGPDTHQPIDACGPCAAVGSACTDAYGPERSGTCQDGYFFETDGFCSGGVQPYLECVAAGCFPGTQEAPVPMCPEPGRDAGQSSSHESTTSSSASTREPLPDAGPHDATVHEDAPRGMDAGLPLDGPTLIPDGGVCSNGSVTFRLIAPAGYQYAPFNGSDNFVGDPPWYSIDGVAWDVNAYTLCETCVQAEYGPYCTQADIPAGGITWTWPGTAATPCGSSPWSGYDECLDTCFSAADGYDLSCGYLTCMPAGHYTATLCAISPSGGCPIGDTCVNVGFDYPASGEIVAYVGGAGDAGEDAPGAMTDAGSVEDAAASMTGS